MTGYQRADPRAIASCAKRCRTRRLPSRHMPTYALDVDRLAERSSEALGPDGPTARGLSALGSRYEVRAGQLSMAEAVADAIGKERVLLCEAGTGTGETLGYLVPAILSGRRV